MKTVTSLVVSQRQYERQLCLALLLFTALSLCCQATGDDVTVVMRREDRPLDDDVIEGRAEKLADDVTTGDKREKMPPIILIPGNGGSQIEAKIERQAEADDSCSHQRDWFRLWLNVFEMFPGES